MKKAAEALAIGSSTVFDETLPRPESSEELEKKPEPSAAEAKVLELHAAAECKGIIACDGRSYLLDIARVTPRDVNFGSVEYDGESMFFFF